MCQLRASTTDKGLRCMCVWLHTSENEYRCLLGIHGNEYLCLLRPKGNEYLCLLRSQGNEYLCLLRTSGTKYLSVKYIRKLRHRLTCNMCQLRKITGKYVRLIEICFNKSSTL